MNWLAVALGLAFLLLYWLAGWVYADARRRGMPAAFWSILALLCPPSFIAYLAFRRSGTNAKREP